MTLAFSTRSVHAGAAPHAGTGARTTPIFFTNGFAFDDFEHAADIFALRRPGFSYSRGSNPTVATLERRLADLEGGSACVAVASGQSAWLVAILALCATGDEYVASNQMFGGSLGLLNRLASRLDVRAVWADPTPDAIAAAVTPRTKAICIESVINPSGIVVDLDAIAAVARAHDVPLVVDATLSSPALMRPIEHGAHVVIHSTSKFLGGHGLVIGGAIIDAGTFDWGRTDRFPLMSADWTEYDNYNPVRDAPATAFATACRLLGLRELGPGLSPMNAFLILTGVETLPLRMERHCRNAEAVAGFLAGHPAVRHVSYPGIPSHPGYEVARRYCPNGCGAIFTAEFRSDVAAKQVLERLNLFSHLVNVGETRSLVAHPASTTHRQMSPSERDRLGVGSAVLRLSVGIETADDLLADLDQALDGLATA